MIKPIYLRTARERKGWTQEQLEAESGVPQNIISKLENIAADAYFSTGLALAQALEVDPLALRFGPDPRREKVLA